MDKSWQTRKSKAVASTAGPLHGKLQRKCACGGQATSGGECEECKKKVQRKADGAAAPATAPPIVQEVLNSPGQPLDAATRAAMEPRFDHSFGRVSVHAETEPASASGLTLAPPAGPLEQEADRMAGLAMQTSGREGRESPTGGQAHDFSQVRVHADARAAESASAVNALAYTAGNHIVFGPGQYRPGSGEGQRLLAHELTHVAQQGCWRGGQSAVSGGRLMQRKVAVDPAKFAGANAAKDKADFEKMIVDELQVVTGMNLSFSSDVLSASGKPAGGSATAQQVLNMALSDPATIFFDPMAGLGGHPTARGIEIGLATPGVVLKSFRPGIIILHELTHFLASKLKPADYDKKMKQMEADAKAGKTLTPEEQEQLTHYDPMNITSDENIAVMIENKIQQESGTIKRIHYGIQIEFPPKPGKTGPAAWTTYAVFKTGDQPPVFLYLDAGNYDLYSSTVDYFDELVKAGKPVAPKAGAMNKIVKGTPAYTAVQKHLL